MDDPTVTHWIAGLKSGDAGAAQRLWERYFHSLVALAQQHLGVVARGGVDGEDVAQSVFKSFCLRAEQGKFPQMGGRDDLWRLLVAMSAYKSRDLMRHHGRLKRGSGRVMDEAALTGSEDDIVDLGEVVGREPTPLFAAQVAEECRHLLGQLNDVERQTAVLKLQGLTNRQIAEQMDCSLRTVDRRLRSVRRIAEIQSSKP
jgi:RNA polymerase sigma factor (sigma-70 family)